MQIQTITLSPTTWSFPSQRRILLLDDELAITAPIARYFRRLAFRVDSADSADAAFDLLSKHEYDAAILDLRLSPRGPEDSIRVFEQIRIQNRHARVIALSAFISEDVECDLHRRGFDAVLRKPQPLPHLAEMVLRLSGEAL